MSASILTLFTGRGHLLLEHALLHLTSKDVLILVWLVYMFLFIHSPPATPSWLPWTPIWPFSHLLEYSGCQVLLLLQQRWVVDTTAGAELVRRPYAFPVHFDNF